MVKANGKLAPSVLDKPSHIGMIDPGTSHSDQYVHIYSIQVL
jgi:hypothetical protein